ncbi:SHOCT domain-containing protein [Geodermatophilus sp. URMC 64]
MGTDQLARDLRTLSDLHARGLLTDEEFAAAKAHELGRALPLPVVPPPAPLPYTDPVGVVPPPVPGPPPDSGPAGSRRRTRRQMRGGLLAGAGVLAALVMAAILAIAHDTDVRPTAVPESAAVPQQSDVPAADGGGSGYQGSSSWGFDHYQGGQPIRPPSSDADLYASQFSDLAWRCSDGVMEACDVLYRITPGGDFHEWFGSSCAGRLAYESNGGCVAAFGASVWDGTASSWGGGGDWGFAFYRSGAVLDPPAADSVLYDAGYASLADYCAAGYLDYCDELYSVTPSDGFYEWFGSSCAGRLYYESDGGCVAALGSGGD